MMIRVVATLALMGAVLAACPAGAAQKQERKRAYKPAERRERQAEAQPTQAADDAAPAAGYEQELQVAKEKRDQQLSDANANETDQRKLEKKKQEIFAQYAAIVAALRDKYEASQADAGTTAPPPAKNRRAKSPYKGSTSDAAAEEAPKGKKRGEKGRNSPDALAEAQEKLAEENARHQTKIDQLNAQLAQAESSDNLREIRRVQKAIDKENNSYNARRTILERRVHDLSGTVPPPPTATAPQP